MVIEQKFKEGEEPDPTPYLFVSLEMKRQDQSKPYDAKTACWVPEDKECFGLGAITGTKGDMVTVKIDGEVCQGDLSLWLLSMVVGSNFQLKQLLVLTGKNIQEGTGGTSEPSKVRESRRHE